MATTYGTTYGLSTPAYGYGMVGGAQDADDKFWRSIVRAIPVAIRLGSTLLAQQKGAFAGPVTVEQVAADKGFADIFRRILPIAVNIVRSLDEPGGMAADTTPLPGPEQEKFWGAIARLVPVALQLGSSLLAQRKGTMGGPVTVDEVADDKGFLSILRSLLPIASQVIGSLDAPGGMASDASMGTGLPATAPAGGEQEKIFGILAAIVPAAVQIASSLLSRRKAFGGPVTAEELAQDKGFLQILQRLLPIATQVVNSLDSPGGMASDAAPSPEQEKFWGAIARLVPVAIQLGSTLLGQRKGSVGAVTADEIAQDKGFLSILRSLLPIATQVVNALDEPGSPTGVPASFANAFR